MKICMIGCGGIGSFLIDDLTELCGMGQISPYNEFFVCDDDIVEVKNLSPYQNYIGTNCVGLNKAIQTAKRVNGKFSLNFVTAIPKRITKAKQLEDYDVIVLCVDNEKTRELVIKFCFKKDRQFIDLRATGRKIFAMPKLDNLKDNMKFIDKKDLNEYSCQDKKDIKNGYIQKGHKIVAMIGVQMLLNILRGYNNRVIAMGV